MLLFLVITWYLDNLPTELGENPEILLYPIPNKVPSNNILRDDIYHIDTALRDEIDIFSSSHNDGEVTIVFKIVGDGTRKLSAFLIDPNDYIWSSTPIISFDELGFLINNSIPIENILYNKSTIISIDKKVRITIDNPLISSQRINGDWNIFIIIWNENQKSSMVIIEPITFYQHKEPNEETFFINL